MSSSLAVASLPMYDHPAVRGATDAFWSALREALASRGIEAPLRLDRRADRASLWREPGLVLSQTCGYPYATGLRGCVRLVGTPVYDVEGCEGARYCSLLIARADEPAGRLADFRGQRAAVNARDSQSGMNALRAAVAPLAQEGRFFGTVVVTGSHAASVAAVAGGRADIAAIDCVSFALLRRHEPGPAGQVRILGRSRPAPGLPFVTAGGRSDREVAALRAALSEVMADPGLGAVCAALHLAGMEVLGDAAYDEILAMEAEAAALGYPRLR